MSRGKPAVQWTLPKWAADLILETVNQDAKSTAFDQRLRKRLLAALHAIWERGLPRVNQYPANGFDLFRLSKSKEVVDVCANTLRAYHRDGLPFHYQGKAIFVSKIDLAAFIRFRSRAERQPEAR